MLLIRILENYAFVVAIAFALGLITGGPPAYPAEITIIALAIMMTLSLSNLKLRGGRMAEIFRPTILAIILNYIFLTGLILLISFFFSEDLRDGWILMAAVPSAVAVVPFSYMIGGDTRLALSGTAVIYLLSLLLVPAISIFGIGQDIERSRLIYTILILILIPIAISRFSFLREMDAGRKTPLINICFGILVFAMTGANRGAFGSEISLVVMISVAAFIRTFGIGSIILWMLGRRGVPDERKKALTLFGSYKNLGLTAAVAMVLISQRAAIPAAICIPFEIAWLITLKARTARKDTIIIQNINDKKTII